MNARDNDTSYIAESLPAFISEAGEHIEMLEQLLLQLEGEPDNPALLDALFRSAHTIKGWQVAEQAWAFFRLGRTHAWPRPKLIAISRAATERFRV